MRKTNSNGFLYIYLLVSYLFALWLSIFMISDLKIIYLLVVLLIIVFKSLSQLTYLVLSSPTLYQENDSLEIKRVFRANEVIKLEEIISLEQVNPLSFIASPGIRTLIKRYKMTIQKNENEVFFYDTFSNGRNISEFAGEIKKENPFFRSSL